MIYFDDFEYEEVEEKCDDIDVEETPASYKPKSYTLLEIEDYHQRKMAEFSRQFPAWTVHPGKFSTHNSNSTTLSLPKNLTILDKQYNSVVNPVNFSSYVLGDNCIDVSLSHTGMSFGGKNWSVFDFRNIKIISDSYKVKRGVSPYFYIQSFAINLNPKANSGFIQFYCKNDVEYVNDSKCKQHQLITLFFYRDMDDFSKKPYPPIITVAPYVEQTYVPLLPNQELSLVVDKKADVEFSFLNSAYTTEHEHFKIYHVLDRGHIDSCDMIFVSNNNKKKNAIIVPSLEREKDNYIAQILEPQPGSNNRSVVIGQSIGSLHVRSLDKIKQVPWIVEQQKVKVNKDDSGTRLDFTDSDYASIIEKHSGYCWLMDDTQRALRIKHD